MKDLIKCSKCGSYYDPRKNCKTCIRKKLWDEDIFPNRVLPLFPTRIQKGLLNFKFPNAVILTGCISDVWTGFGWKDHVGVCLFGQDHGTKLPVWELVWT